MGRSDLRIGNIPGRREDERHHRTVTQKKLPCGGTKHIFLGSRKGRMPTPARRPHMIIDKRHFAGVKAHDTKLRHQAKTLVGRVQALAMFSAVAARSLDMASILKLPPMEEK